MLRQGDMAGARAYYEQALAIGQEIGDLSMQGASLNSLGMVAYQLEEDVTARDYFLQSVAVHREIGAIGQEIINLNNLAGVTTSLGDYAAARSFFEEGLRLALRQGENRGKRILAFLLEGIASPLLRQGEAERAVRVLSAGTALRDRLGMPRPPEEIPEHEKLVADLKNVLGEEAFAAAREVGRTMTLEQAIRDALTDANVHSPS
jgi:tetratricopeptide (TPR) repeat protein